MIYKNSDENELAIFNSSNTNVTKILVMMNNNDNIMDVDDNFRDDNIWIDMAVDNLLVASNNYYTSGKIYLCIINGYDYHDYDNCKWQLLDRYYLMSVSRNSSVLLLFMQCVPEKQISINCYSLCYSYESLNVTEPINLVMIFNEMEILNLKLNKIKNKISYKQHNDDDDDTFNNEMNLMLMMTTKLMLNEISMQRKDKKFDNKKIFINNNNLINNNKMAATLTFIFNNNIDDDEDDDDKMTINAMNNDKINSNIFGITTNTYNNFKLQIDVDDDDDDVIIKMIMMILDVNINNLKGATVPNKKIFKNIIKIQEINQSQCIHNNNNDKYKNNINNNSNIIYVNDKNYRDDDNNNIIKNFNKIFYFLKEFNQINYKFKINYMNSVPDNNDINNNYKINIPAIINNIDLLQSLDDLKLDVASASQMDDKWDDNSMMPKWIIGYNILNQNDGKNIHTISHQNRINDNVDNDDDDHVQYFIDEHYMWPAFMLYKQPICKSFTHTNIKPNTISTTETTTKITTTTTTTNIMITQSDMNKSEYAFKKTLNSFKSILMDKDSVMIDSDLANQQRIMMMHNGRTTNQKQQQQQQQQQQQKQQKQELHEKPDNDLLNKLQQSMIIDHIDESDDNNDKYKNLQKLYKQSGIVFDHNFIKLMNFNKANATNNLKHNNLIKQVISDNKNLNTCDIDEKNDYFNDAKSDEYKNVMNTKQFDDNVNMLQPPLKPKLLLSSNNNYMPFDQLTKIVAREKELVNYYYEKIAIAKDDATNNLSSSIMASNDRWGIPRMMRLRGGVEQALNNGTTGWGSPPSSSSSTNAGSWGPTSNTQQPAQQWGATSQQPGNYSFCLHIQLFFDFHCSEV